MQGESIKRVAVIGAGLMGFGIGIEFARFGYEASLYNTTEASSKRAMENAREDLDLMVETQLITAAEAEAAYKRLYPTINIADAVSGADYVIESVIELLSLKQEIFAQLDELCPPPTILATNTTGFRVTDIAIKTKHPERILTTHYFQPPHFIPLVEVGGGEKTDRAFVELAARILRGLRKKVVVYDTELPGRGLPGNRIQWSLGPVVRALVDEGICNPETIDDLIQFGFGRRLAYTGYFKRQDLIGLDFGLHQAKEEGRELWWPVAEHVNRGELGMKSGKGFYDWPDDNKKWFLRYFNTELIRLMKHDMDAGYI